MTDVSSSQDTPPPRRLMTAPRHSLVNRTFGWLEVKEFAGFLGPKRLAKYVCECQCGTVLEVYSHHLKQGNTRSCGCLHTHVKATRGRLTVVHRSTYMTWFSHFRRSETTGCPEWTNPDTGFERFLEDMGPRPSGTALLRKIDPEDLYHPGNCYWGPPQEARQEAHQPA